MNCTVKNGLKLKKTYMVSMGEVVSKNVPDDTIVTGNLAIGHSKFKKIGD